MSAADYAEIDGQPAGPADLHVLATVNYGHYTTMQVRDRRVRGLVLHLERLDTATRELFGAGLEHDRVRQRLRHALDRDDASVRITVFGQTGEPSLLVSVSEPIALDGTPARLRSVPFVRALPHIKHVGSFPQAYHR